MSQTRTADGDQELWDGISRSDPAAWEALQELVANTCPAVFRRKGVTPDDLESLSQEVLVSVWNYSSSSADRPRNLTEFLRWRARGVFSRYLAKRRSAARLEGLALPIDPEDERSRPWDEMSAAELARGLEECRDSLTGHYRKVWTCRHEQELDPRQTAAELDIPVGRVNLCLHRAKNHLWDCLRRKGLTS